MDIDIDALAPPKANNLQHLDVQDEPSEVCVGTYEDSTPNDQSGVRSNRRDETRRDPGRPRKLKTGKPGRPSKKYNLVPTIQEEPDEDRQRR